MLQFVAVLVLEAGHKLKLVRSAYAAATGGDNHHHHHHDNILLLSNTWFPSVQVLCFM